MESIVKAIVDKMVEEAEKQATKILKDSEGWSKQQKIAGFLVCLLAAALLVSGGSYVKVVGAASIAIFGIALLTFSHLTVKSLVLKDSKGNPRIAISAGDGMTFYDENKQVRMMFFADSKDAMVVLKRPGDKGASLYLRVTDDRAVASIGEKANVHVVAADDGNLGLVLANEGGQPTAILGNAEISGHLAFFGRTGLTVADYPDA